MPDIDWIELISKTLRADFGGFVTWEDSLTVKTSPHSEIARLYGAACNLYTEREIWLLDNNGDWFRLETKDRNYEVIASSVVQRLRLLKLIKEGRLTAAMK